MFIFQYGIANIIGFRLFNLRDFAFINIIIDNKKSRQYIYNILYFGNNLHQLTKGNFFLMRIIALKTLREYWEKEPDSKEALSAWHQEALAASWNGPADIKEKYRSASILKGSRVVFNICGNKYRLVVKINYKFKIIYIRFVGTHKEYDSINVEEI